MAQEDAQIPSVWNTKVVTSADAQPASPWIGNWELVRERGIVRMLTTLYSATSSGLGGTFTFEFSEDGNTATISEVRSIDDFATIRDFDLLNAGKWYRVKFEPDVALGANTVIITTTFMTAYQGAFVRLGNQELEEQNAALPSQFAYLKAFRTGGKSIGITATRGGAMVMADEGTQIARGIVAGSTGLNIFGRNPDVDTTSDPEDVWLGGGEYTGHPTGSPETVEVFSSSIDDNGVTSGGALTVRIHGLATSAATAYTTEDITMNGTTAVTSSGSWYRVNKLEVLTAGSGATNTGAITCRHTTTTANVFVSLGAGTGHSAIGVYTVPQDATLYISNIHVHVTRASGASGSANVVLACREFGTSSWQFIRNWEIDNRQSADEEYKIPLVIPAQADIKFRIVSVSDSDTIAGCSFEGVLADD